MLKHPKHLKHRKNNESINTGGFHMAAELKRLFEDTKLYGAAHPTGGADAFIRRAIPDATPREITAGLELLAWTHDLETGEKCRTQPTEKDVIEVLTKARRMMASRGLDTDGKPLARQGAGAGRG
jgi:hypothetical protein